MSPAVVSARAVRRAERDNLVVCLPLFGFCVGGGVNPCVGVVVDTVVDVVDDAGVVD